MSLVIIATVRPKADHHEDVLEALKTAAVATHEEPGCEMFAVHSGREELIVIESWADKDSLQAHQKNEAFQTLAASIAPWLREPLDIQVVRPVPAGHQAKGTLVQA